MYREESYVPFVRAPTATRLRIADAITADWWALHVDSPRDVVLGHSGGDRGKGKYEPRQVPHDAAQRGAQPPRRGQQFRVTAAVFVLDLSFENHRGRPGFSRHRRAASRCRRIERRPGPVPDRAALF